ncbi:MAG TPA: DUF721 domain-containing protein [Chlamydiales bacterium]|nr:DUF721 domain-containing protein [Chlamydiales bacterium]
MIERTKRHFNGTAPTGKKISDLLPIVLNEITNKTGDDREQIFQFWFSLIGEKITGLTQPISLKNGILTIKVKSATLYSLLCQHEKPRLLKELQAKFEIHDLVFRVG